MNASSRYDAAIVGAGIIGLAHAYHFAKAGLKVAVFERGLAATGASIRNFGMIWPIGQPPGEMREIAVRSREIWLDVLSAAGIWHERCGSLHLAYHSDEWAVLEEFAAKSRGHGYDCALLTSREVLDRSPSVRSEGLRGALWSPSELSVYPPGVVPGLATYLEGLGVEMFFGRSVTEVESGKLMVSGREIRADQIVVCLGDDFETLFPDRLATLGMTRSKLQMLRARSRSGVRIGSHLCAGLTLGHYANFRICDRLADLQDRYRREMPEYVDRGIHLLVSQHEDGQLTIGDSHEYGLAVTPFRDETTDALMLAYLDTFLAVEDLEITERWYGVYAKHPERGYIVDSPLPGIHIVTGVGGAGMTLSFGLAERVATLLALSP